MKLWMVSFITWKRMKILPPTSLKEDLFKSLHAGQYSAHLGITKTYCQAMHSLLVERDERIYGEKMQELVLSARGSRLAMPQLFR